MAFTIFDLKKQVKAPSSYRSNIARENFRTQTNMEGFSEVLLSAIAGILGDDFDTTPATTISSAHGRLNVIEGDNTTAGSIAKSLKDAKDYADQKITDLVNGAPSVLDTLKEIADALGNDANLASTLAGQISGLDGRLDTLEGDAQTSGSVAHAVSVEASLRADAVSTEESSRAAADASLATDLSAEVSRATATEGSLATDLSSEVSRALDAEDQIQQIANAHYTASTNPHGSTLNQTNLNVTSDLHVSDVTAGNGLQVHSEGPDGFSVIIGDSEVWSNGGMHVWPDSTFHNNAHFSREADFNEGATFQNGRFTAWTLGYPLTIGVKDNDSQEKGRFFLADVASGGGSGLYTKGNSFTTNLAASDGSIGGGYTVQGADSINMYASNAISFSSDNSGFDVYVGSFQPKIYAYKDQDTGLRGDMGLFLNAGDNVVVNGYNGITLYSPGGNIYLNSPLNNQSGAIEVAEGVTIDGVDISAWTATTDGRLNILEGDNTTAGSVAKAQADAQAYTDQAVTNLVNGAPALLDTLKEIADALGNDANLASTLAGQISGLDGRLDTLEGDATTSGSVAHAVSVEASLRTAAVSSEASSRVAGDSSLAAAVSAEASRADAAEASLASAVSAEASRAGSAEASLTTSVSAEASDRASAVSSEASSRQAADASLASDLSAEASDRAAAVSSEASRATAAEASLASSISSEASRATAAEASISTVVSSEISRIEGMITDVSPAFAATTLGADLAVDDTVTVPAYTVGAGANMMVWANGMMLTQGASFDYVEVGTAGTVSTTIQVKVPMNSGWVIRTLILK